MKDEQLSLFGSGSVLDVSHANQYEQKITNIDHYEPEIAEAVGYWYTGMLNEYARRMDGSFGFCCCDSSDSRIGKTDSIDCKDCQFHYNGDTECAHNKWKRERAVWKGDKNEEH